MMKTKIYKLIVFSVLCSLFSVLCFSQTYQWQWAKNGGGSLRMQNESSGVMGNNFNFEHIQDIVTDEENNYYFLGKIAHGNSHVDGNDVPTFGNTIQGNNIIITSFTCNGTYRWSRVIFGGGYLELVQLTSWFWITMEEFM